MKIVLARIIVLTLATCLIPLHAVPVQRTRGVENSTQKLAAQVVLDIAGTVLRWVRPTKLAIKHEDLARIQGFLPPPASLLQPPAKAFPIRHPASLNHRAS